MARAEGNNDGSGSNEGGGREGDNMRGSSSHFGHVILPLTRGICYIMRSASVTIAGRAWSERHAMSFTRPLPMHDAEGRSMRGQTGSRQQLKGKRDVWMRGGEGVRGVTSRMAVLQVGG